MKEAMVSLELPQLLVTNSVKRVVPELDEAMRLMKAMLYVEEANVTTSVTAILYKGDPASATAISDRLTVTTNGTNQKLDFVLIPSNCNIDADTPVWVQLQGTGTTCLISNAQAVFWFDRPLNP